MTYICACGDTYTEEIAANGHAPLDAVVENEVAPTCENTGSYDNVVYCDECGEEISRESVVVDALTHTDADGDNQCDNGCGYEFENDDCNHMCHKQGFMGFIWKIVKFFSKLFGTNPTCECGVAHY